MPLDQPPSSDTSEAPDPVDGFRMPLGDHIEELRRYLIRALIGVAGGLVIAVIFGYDIIAWIAVPVVQAQYALGYPPQTVDTSASFGMLSVYVPVTLIAAVIFASPWIIYQFWRFVVTGLYDREKRAVYILAPFSTVMTVLAVLFTRYVLLPVCILFFLRFAASSPVIEAQKPEFMIRILTGWEGAAAPLETSATPLHLPVIDGDPQPLTDGALWVDRTDHRVKLFVDGQVHAMMMSNNRLITPLPELGRQIKFAAMLGLGIVIAFQIPVFMLVVGWTGLVDPTQVAKMRKYALLASAVLGALLTPTDPVSMVMLWLPIYGLFEFGLLLMRLVTPQIPDEL